MEITSRILTAIFTLDVDFIHSGTLDPNAHLPSSPSLVGDPNGPDSKYRAFLVPLKTFLMLPRDRRTDRRETTSTTICPSSLFRTHASSQGCCAYLHARGWVALSLHFPARCGAYSFA